MEIKHFLSNIGLLGNRTKLLVRKIRRNRVKKIRVKNGQSVETKNMHFLVRIYASVSNHKTFRFKWMFQNNHIITSIYKSLTLS